MADILSVKIPNSTLGRIKNYQQQLKGFLGKKISNVCEVSVDGQQSMVLAVEQNIREKIGSLTDEVINMKMKAVKLDDTIQLSGT